LQARLAGIERMGARFEADLANRNGQDATTKQRLDRISDRLAKLEKMAWMALGGLVAVGSVATFFGWNIHIVPFMHEFMRYGFPKVINFFS